MHIHWKIRTVRMVKPYLSMRSCARTDISGVTITTMPKLVDCETLATHDDSWPIILMNITTAMTFV